MSEDKPIIKFTNIFNEVNYGIIIDTDPGGMKEILWDEFSALLERISNANDFVKAGWRVRTSWVRVDNERNELLPINARISWNSSELAARQAQMKRDGKVTATPDVPVTELPSPPDEDAANVFRGQEVD